MMNILVTDGVTEEGIELLRTCAHVKSGGWERGRFMGTEVRGKVLGIFGLGRAGAEVAKRALALGMKVLAYDPGVSASKAASMGVVPAEPSDVFANSDFISLHVPVTPETVGLVPRETIAIMKHAGTAWSSPCPCRRRAAKTRLSTQTRRGCGKRGAGKACLLLTPSHPSRAMSPYIDN
ncbi:MAG: NAD(P)-dependent oxidoreductase [Clostridia bacterium]